MFAAPQRAAPERAQRSIAPAALSVPTPTFAAAVTDAPRATDPTLSTARTARAATDASDGNA